MSVHSRRLLMSIALVFCATTIPLAVPAHAQRVRDSERKNVLIVGDSVAAVLSWYKPSQKPFWISQFNLVLEVHGCQVFFGPGCLDAKTGAVDLVKQHRNDNIDIVVVMTGYNDRGIPKLKRAISAISRETKAMGASLVWGTYRQVSPILRKAWEYNTYLRKNAKNLGIDLFDWNAISIGQSSWFRGNGIHMNAVGGIHFARSLKNFLDRHVAKLAA